MAGDEGREAVARAEGPGRARRPGRSGERRQLTVGDDGAARQPAQDACTGREEPVRIEVELDVGEIVRLAGEEALEAARQGMRGRRGLRRGRPGQLAVQHAAVLEPELTHAEARGAVAMMRRSHPPMLYRRASMRRRGLMPTYAPLLGFAYVPLGILALALGSRHPQAASALFTVAAFAFLWFLGSLHARIIRYDPEGFFASIVVLGGASLLALQAAALASRDALVAAPGAACAATVIIGSSLAAINARKVTRWLGRLGIVGGLAVLGVGVLRGRRELDVRRLDLLGLLARLHDLGARHRHLPRP